MTFLPDLPLTVLAVIGVVFAGLCVWRMIVAPGQRLGWVRRTLMVVCVLAMALRPGVPGGEVPTGSINVNVVLLVDTSQSMAAEDYSPTRLDGVREDVRDIAYAYAGANISVITFDSTAQVRVPFTDDGSAVIEMLRAMDVEIGYYSRGSSISAGKDQLIETLEAAEANDPGAPTLVFYFGDGEQTVDEAQESFADAAGMVDGGFVLGYGTAEGGRMRESTFDGPADNYVQDPAGGDALSKIDEGALQQIAGELGIGYLHRSPDVAFSTTLETMAQAQGEVDLTEYREARLELYWLFAIPLAGLLLWEVVSVARSARLAYPKRGGSA